jgi:preprotein translocase subunit SecF
MINNKKSGKSLILLSIVILVMSFALFFVSRVFNNNGVDKAQEEAFKLNVYEYYLEIEDYKTQLAQTEGYDEEEVNACGVELQTIIPDMIETDLSKFKIEQGKLIYIGCDEQEKQWTKEVRI